ncbi:hypothetical protein H6G91_03900 [Nostoc muscorum FACHB-395]|nr:hypothetical protein [Desmonostoc muscorum FACHB-395]
MGIYLLLITHYSRITVRTLLLTETLRERERQGRTRQGVCQIRRKFVYTRISAMAYPPAVEVRQN